MVVAFTAFAGATSAFAKPSLVVGSKKFTESYVLGEILAQTARRVGEADVSLKQGLGGTGIVYQALLSGQIDLYPEYTGTISQDILKEKGVVSLDQLNAQLAPQGLAVGVPLGFNDTYAFAMREDQARKLGIKSISDLAKHPELRMGLDQEFLTRADGWPGVKAAYGLPFGTPQGFDHGLAYTAISEGKVDVIDMYSTDANVARFHLRVLTDDKGYFPDYSAVLLYRADLPKRLPKTWAAFEKLSGKIDGAEMVNLNADVDIRGQTYASAARQFLSGGASGAVSRGGLWAQTFDDQFGRLTLEHLFLVFSSLILAIAVGVPLGVVAFRRPGVGRAILGGAGLIQTIPSIALLVFLLAATGHTGDPPAIIALFLYALLPIVRNTYTGLESISPALRESAIALGLSRTARLWRVELPLASQSIMAGIKTSAVINVGTATIAAFIGAGGYGERIVSGLNNLDDNTVLAGAIPAAVLALLVQGGFDLLDRVVVPAGLRRRAAN